MLIPLNLNNIRNPPWLRFSSHFFVSVLLLSVDRPWLHTKTKKILGIFTSSKPK